MKGHIRERGAGNWYAVLDRRDPATGKRKRKWQRLRAKRKREAQTECAQLISQLSEGTYIEPSKTTLKQFLEKWLEHIKPNVAPHSHQRYEELALKNIAPLLGDVILSKLQPIQISTAYAKAVASGRRDGKGGSSVRAPFSTCIAFCAGHWQQAVKWNMLIKNPCDLLEKKDRALRSSAKRSPSWTRQYTMRMLEAARGTRWFIPMLLGSMCGIRRGEILGAVLAYYVQLETGENCDLATQSSKPKTAAGKRRPRAPSAAPSPCRALLNRGVKGVADSTSTGIIAARYSPRWSYPHRHESRRHFTHAPKQLTDNVMQFYERSTAMLSGCTA